MYVVNIASFIGTPNAIIHKFGLQVYEHVVGILASEKDILLDFTDLKNVTTGFFHASVGNLYKKYGDQFYTLIHFRGINNPDWKEKFQDAIDLVKEPKRGLEIDQAISELFES